MCEKILNNGKLKWEKLGKNNKKKRNWVNNKGNKIQKKKEYVNMKNKNKNNNDKKRKMKFLLLLLIFDSFC